MPEHTIAENLSRLITAKTDIANAITTMGGTVNTGDGFEEFPDDILTIPNRYTSSDEGKVVYNGGLVAQTTATRTTNGTVDTTRIKSLTVNVPTETPVISATIGPANSAVTLSDGWIGVYNNRLVFHQTLDTNGPSSDISFTKLILNETLYSAFNIAANVNMIFGLSDLSSPYTSKINFEYPGPISIKYDSTTAFDLSQYYLNFFTIPKNYGVEAHIFGYSVNPIA